MQNINFSGADYPVNSDKSIAVLMRGLCCRHDANGHGWCQYHGNNSKVSAVRARSR